MFTHAAHQVVVERSVGEVDVGERAFVRHGQTGAVVGIRWRDLLGWNRFRPGRGSERLWIYMVRIDHHLRKCFTPEMKDPITFHP